MTTEGTRRAEVRRRYIEMILRIACIGVLLGILVAGLRPFHAPKNEVSWLRNGNGLRFGDFGTVLSSRAFKIANANPEGPGSLEVWIEPGLTYDSNTFVAFYSSENPEQFSMHQSHSDLALQLDACSRQRQKTSDRRLYIDDVFRQGKGIFITATTNGEQTAVYINGLLVRTSSDFGLSGADFAGQLVMSSLPSSDDTWSGRFRGLAIYDHQLTAAQVLQHYQTWVRGGRPDVTKSEGVLALYLFNEHFGSIVHNQVRDGVDLYIPSHYVLLHQQFLERPWDEYRPGWAYWKNVLINIGGFAPLGFFFYAYLLGALRPRRAVLATVLLGAAVSLTIEILQAYLPTRDSGMTDLMTNTFGTWGGVMMYRSAAVVCARLSRSQFARIRRVARLMPLQHKVESKPPNACGMA